MFLRRLSLTNVRSIPELELSFEAAVGAHGNGARATATRKWTLILGENGTGKSSVLRAVGLLLAGSEALPELLVLGGPDAWIRNGAKEARIAATLRTAAGDERELSLTLRRGVGISRTLSENAESLGALDAALAHSARSYLTVGYGVSRRLNTGRKVVSPESGFRNPRAQSVATMFNPDAVLQSLETWAMDLHYRRGAAGLAVIRDALRGLLPDVAFKQVDKRNRRLLFETLDGEVPLSALSDGYQNVAAWCGDLLYRVTETFQDYRRPLEARGLLLIDELELHLHPLWQRQLRHFIDEKLPNFQILATTHSALTAQQAEVGELFSLRRDASARSVLYAFPAEPQKFMVHQLLMSDLIGLRSIDSPQVEAKKDEYRRLKAKPQHSAADKSRLGDLRAELQDMPDWSRESPRDREALLLLRDIKRELLPQRRAVDRPDATRGAAEAGRLSEAAQAQTTLVKPRALKRAPRTATKKTVATKGATAKGATARGATTKGATTKAAAKKATARKASGRRA